MLNTVNAFSRFIFSSNETFQNTKMYYFIIQFYYKSPLQFINTYKLFFSDTFYCSEKYYIQKHISNDLIIRILFRSAETCVIKNRKE